MRHFCLATSVLFLAVSLLGCGGESGPTTYPVSGTVTLDGEPIKGGRIALWDAEGKVATAAGTVTNGEYSLQSQPGKKLVKITARREVPGKFDTSNPGEKHPVIEQYIPSQYNEKTTLTEEVTPEGENQFNFELTNDGQ